MTIAIREILQQVKLLSPKEQLELFATLAEQAQQTIKTMSIQAWPTEAEAPPMIGAEASASDEEENWLDTLDLKMMPPKRTYTVRARFHKVGRLQPLPYDFGDFFDHEEERES